MINQPERIYLVLDLDGENSKNTDFKDLTEISWCENKISGSDLPYYSSDFLINLFSARIGEINKELQTVSTSTMSGGQKANRLRGIKKELKQWITKL